MRVRDGIVLEWQQRDGAWFALVAYIIEANRVRTAGVARGRAPWRESGETGLGKDERLLAAGVLEVFIAQHDPVRRRPIVCRVLNPSRLTEAHEPWKRALAQWPGMDAPRLEWSSLEVSAMATPKDPAAFLVKAAAAVVRLELTALEPDDASFRELVLREMVDGIPIPRPFEDLQEHLLAGTDPVVVLSEAFAKQAAAYSESAARATVTVAQLAVEHLYATGGEGAVVAFLDDMQSHGDDEGT